MSRYDNINIALNDTNKRYYDLLLYPEIEQLPGDIFIITKANDRLDLLAYKYYNDSTLYWIISICNNITNTLFPEPGTQLCIPNFDRINDIIVNLGS